MYWDRDVECERPIVHHVDREEQSCTGDPFLERYRRRLDKKAVSRVELIVQSRQASKYKLEEGDE